MALDLVLPRRTASEDESLAHFVTRRLGREALRRIAQPMVGGIYTGDPEHLSLQATMPQFLAMEQRHGSLIRAMWHNQRVARQQGSHQAGHEWGPLWSVCVFSPGHANACRSAGSAPTSRDGAAALPRAPPGAAARHLPLVDTRPGPSRPGSRCRVRGAARSPGWPATHAMPCRAGHSPASHPVCLLGHCQSRLQTHGCRPPVTRHGIRGTGHRATHPYGVLISECQISWPGATPPGVAAGLCRRGLATSPL